MEKTINKEQLLKFSDIEKCKILIAIAKGQVKYI